MVGEASRREFQRFPCLVYYYVCFVVFVITYVFFSGVQWMACSHTVLSSVSINCRNFTLTHKSRIFLNRRTELTELKNDWRNLGYWRNSLWSGWVAWECFHFLNLEWTEILYFKFVFYNCQQAGFWLTLFHWYLLQKFDSVDEGDLRVTHSFEHIANVSSTGGKSQDQIDKVAKTYDSVFMTPVSLAQIKKNLWNFGFWVISLFYTIFGLGVFPVWLQDSFSAASEAVSCARTLSELIVTDKVSTHAMHLFYFCLIECNFDHLSFCHFIFHLPV